MSDNFVINGLTIKKLQSEQRKVGTDPDVISQWKEKIKAHNESFKEIISRLPKIEYEVNDSTLSKEEEAAIIISAKYLTDPFSNEDGPFLARYGLEADAIMKFLLIGEKEEQIRTLQVLMKIIEKKDEKEYPLKKRKNYIKLFMDKKPISLSNLFTIRLKDIQNHENFENYMNEELSPGVTRRSSLSSSKALEQTPPDILDQILDAIMLSENFDPKDFVNQGIKFNQEIQKLFAVYSFYDELNKLNFEVPLENFNFELDEINYVKDYWSNINRIIADKYIILENSKENQSYLSNTKIKSKILNERYILVKIFEIENLKDLINEKITITEYNAKNFIENNNFFLNFSVIL